MLFDEDLDTAGQRCPLPVLKARKRIKALSCGAILRLYSDDPVSVIDVPHFCEEDGHTLVGRTEIAEGWHYYIRKGA